MLKIGQRSPKIGQKMPKMGQRLPELGRKLLKMRQRSPELGRKMLKMGRLFKKKKKNEIKTTAADSMGGRQSQKGKNNSVIATGKKKTEAGKENLLIGSESKKKNNVDRVSEKQRKIVTDVESGKIPLEGYEGHKKGNHTRKGNYGEMKTDLHMEKVTEINGKEVTLTPLHKRTTDIDTKTRKGIDNIYECSNPPPKYVIADSKYGSSKLGDTKDGKQMSDDWIRGSNRLDNIVGKKKAKEIKDALDNGEVHKVLSKVSDNGDVITQKLDSLGKIIGIWP